MDHLWILNIRTEACAPAQYQEHHSQDQQGPARLRQLGGEGEVTKERRFFYTRWLYLSPAENIVDFFNKENISTKGGFLRLPACFNLSFKRSLLWSITYEYIWL